MKYFEDIQLENLPGKCLDSHTVFQFSCHPKIGCFNRCCRNLNLFLHPYDVLRLRKALGIRSDEFLEGYVDVVLRDETHFPDVLLKMADEKEKPCVFLSPSGCTVYAHRPHTCRLYPLEQGRFFDAAAGETRLVHFLRPFEFCLGPLEKTSWTPGTWSEDQNAGLYNEMTVLWSDLKRLFRENPWEEAGLSSPKGKMAFMAVYNIDRFREFVFGSSFLKRYPMAPAVVKQIQKDDIELLKFGFDWVRYLVWGIPGPHFKTGPG